MYQVWPIIKLIQYILSRKVQLNSWQALIKPWDVFCGPLEVRTHPLPAPDSGASFSSFGVFVFEIWVLRSRSRVLRFRVLGASFSRFGCFVLRSSFSKLPSHVMDAMNSTSQNAVLFMFVFELLCLVFLLLSVWNQTIAAAGDCGIARL